MSSGERPIGAAKGKQSDTEALCQTPPPLRVLVPNPALPSRLWVLMGLRCMYREFSADNWDA